ncbi:MAG: DegV family protein [Clostridia bacterium]|nr:DegV family protein [Clostridia bacterium]
MSFRIFTDTSSNLPMRLLVEENIPLIPFSFYPQNDSGALKQVTDIEAFDGKAYYDSIRNGILYNTSQIAPQAIFDALAPAAEAGEDCLFISMSSGISGSFNSSEIAMTMLREQYPERRFFTLDTKAASLGEGIAVLKAVEYRRAGLSVEETFRKLTELVPHICQVFTVADLGHLCRTGRLSNAARILGTVLNIRPILKGNENGQIVNTEKVRGSKKAIKRLAEIYDELVENPGEQTVCIAHADNDEDTAYLVRLLNENKPPKEILTVCYEPVTGAHVGPGTVALFFLGGADVRMK